MSLPTDMTNYWRRKLSAFMHDNPSKPFDIKNHEERAILQQKVDGLQDEERFEKKADFQASAADRLPFPHAGKEGVRVSFSEGINSFHHPLSPGEETKFRIDSSRLTADLADEISQANRPYLEESNARADFIARWRFWRAWCSDRSQRLAYLPADTRVPDHSIWNHMGMTSAFQGCIDRDSEGRAALLLFTIGPVQSFIAAARNIRDLWSGSYLLSYLMSAAIGKLAEEYGPDHVIFPNAWGQPLIDLQMRSIYESAKVRGDFEETLWDQFWSEDPQVRQGFLVPSLPNRMLAVLPADEAAEFAEKMEQTIRERLQLIGEEVLKQIDLRLSKREIDFDPETFRRQVGSSLEVHWHLLPMPNTISDALEKGKKHLPTEKDAIHSSVASIERLSRMWAALPEKHHTSYGMRNAASAWPVVAALNAWCLDGVKGTRLFSAWDDRSSWNYGRDCTKDSLTGKEEALLSVPTKEKEAAELSKKLGGGNRHLLRQGDHLGAMTLIKRFWHLYYLSNPKYYDFKPEDFRMPNLHQLASGDPFGSDETGESEDADGYYAVLALDGDEMGKWISGEKLPKVKEQLHPKALEYFEGILGKDDIQAFLEGSRPLNPSFHLQFSEALANFGKYAVRRIVESFDGRLIYAGGDDVLALLPAKTAIECAQALRAAFRGEPAQLKKLKGVWKNRRKSKEVKLFSSENPDGYIRLHSDLKEEHSFEYEPLEWPALVLGPKADVSVGIAVGHIKSPLQDLVKAAQAAEKRAKTVLNRGAVSIAIFKRSGEQIEWGCKWGEDPNSGLLGFYDAIHRELISEKLSGRFPYQMYEVLSPFLPRDQESAEMDAGFSERIPEIIEIELKRALKRQYSGDGKKASEFGAQMIDHFTKAWADIEALHKEPADRLRSFLGLLQLAAWTSRSASKPKQPEISQQTSPETVGASS